MLEQYIMNCMKEKSVKLSELEEQKKRISLEKESCQNMIQRLTENVDVGREFFSPRNVGDTTKQKVIDIKKQAEELQLQKIMIEDQILQLTKEINKYEDMLDEIKKRDNEKYQIKQLKKEPPILNEKEEFKNILARIEKCINFVENDPTRCMKELENLKYYLKALLSEK